MIIQGQQIKIPVQHGKYIFRINSEVVKISVL